MTVFNDYIQFSNSDEKVARHLRVLGVNFWEV